MENLRAFIPHILSDLQEKMVFLSGPRQVGKTTLSRQLLNVIAGQYLNWDFSKDRKLILEGKWDAQAKLIVLDELHKYIRWKSWLKGHFDIQKEKHAFLVTGSARLNVYRKGGDSLLGRFHAIRLHPFSLCELDNNFRPLEPSQKILPETPSEPLSNENSILQLFQFGGFPEPLFKANARHHRRWLMERLDVLFREDLRDLTHLRELSLVRQMADMLPEKVASPLSLNSLREDLEVNHGTVKLWLENLEQLYYCYRVFPYAGNMARALKKEAKVYLWDWSQVENEGPRFENMVASHLLKFCHYHQDINGHPVELWYLRDQQKRECDFFVTHKKKPWFAVECKLSKPDSSHLKYYMEELKIPQGFCVYLNGDENHESASIRYCNATSFFKALGV